ncbi:MAG: AIPR family protein [Alphaproteobacteria bacterium]|nr:AIPR family protein [Alphaproteobacteria bacterium]
MPSTNNETYDYIINKINSIKCQYPSLRNKPNEYVFNALVVKSMFYKNPANEVTGSDFDDIIVDGRADGGVDILLTDPNSETDDLIIGQSKFYKTISFEECSNAINKMADFYLDLSQGHYENVNEMVAQRFSWLNGNVGDESKIKFVLFTSAPKNNIRFDRLQKTLYNKLADQSKFELVVLFDTDIIEEIKEAESRRPSVDSGEIDIDVANNWLEYEDMAAIVNVSAFSIKELYVKHSNNLLARNLRYHVSGASVDRAIEDSINNKPELFWLKNNGITIICDNFKLDGKKVKLTNFSIVNGGQTTYKIRKNKNISKDYDFYLPCKIVKVQGKDEDEKSNFSLEIAKATNSQKAIKNSDLKANAPEQVRFSQAMRDVGIFYQTKRGEDIPNLYKAKELHSDIAQIGKLCLSGIFQMPCSSRNKPSTIYADRYYNDIFNRNQQQIAKLCKELLYIDCYFTNTFIKQYVKKATETPNSEIKIQFASNARTVCTAFVMLASRYYQNNFRTIDLNIMFKAADNDKLSDNTDVYNIVKNIEGISWILPPEIFANKDKYDETLYKLFSLIIQYGSHDLMMLSRNSTESVVASNYLKKDKNYIDIISGCWDLIEKEIKDIFSGLQHK